MTRVFWLTLFAFGAVAVLVFGWQDGVPWTAAAFVAFFVSRVWRSVIKRPLIRVGRTTIALQPHQSLHRRHRRRLRAAGVLASIAAWAAKGRSGSTSRPAF